MTRLKLPPYGKALLDRRRGGDHPLSVNLVYGDRWREVEPPRVALDPKDYAPGRYDFHMLAGLRVMIHDQLAGGWEMDASILPAIYGKFYDLAAEVAAADAYVLLRWPKGTEPRETELLPLAHSCRWWCTERRAWQWPRWWNDALNTQQQARAQAWFLDVNGDRERVRAAA